MIFERFAVVLDYTYASARVADFRDVFFLTETAGSCLRLGGA